MTGQLFSNSPLRAHLGVGEDACYVVDLNESSGFREMKARRNAATAERATLASIPTRRDIIEGHRMMAHPSERITRMMVKALKLTGG